MKRERCEGSAQMWRDDRAVATTEGDIAEVLEAETLVDMQKLRELSQGIDGVHGFADETSAYLAYEGWL